MSNLTIVSVHKILVSSVRYWYDQVATLILPYTRGQCPCAIHVRLAPLPILKLSLPQENGGVIILFVVPRPLSPLAITMELYGRTL